MHRKIRRYVRNGMLTHLCVFDAVVRLKSYTRAGEELHMAQPTVSIHMKKLGDVIGTPLVENSGRALQLTPTGEKVHAAAQEILRTLHALDDELTRSAVALPAPVSHT
jgi:LysR family transcriptional regulator, low CO2-responsive transcriptional regulator